MKYHLIACLFLSIIIISSFCRADSTSISDTIEIRQNEYTGMNNYYYEDMRLKSQESYFHVFNQSPNPNVMKNFLKWKRLNGSELLISFGGILLSTYYLFYLKPEVDVKDLRYLPIAAICCISVGVPTSIVRHKYLKNAIREFNTKRI